MLLARDISVDPGTVRKEGGIMEPVDRTIISISDRSDAFDFLRYLVEDTSIVRRDVPIIQKQAFLN